jgi:hypothetical protein
MTHEQRQITKIKLMTNYNKEKILKEAGNKTNTHYLPGTGGSLLQS